MTIKLIDSFKKASTKNGVEMETLVAYIDFIMIGMYSIVIGVLASSLAKEKGRHVTRWTILGLVPIVNFIAFMYFVGAANLKIERKLDELLSRKTQ